MQCQICQHTASGNHYGSICCRACAAFFRRTILMKLRYRCRKNESCHLTKETRYCCRHCRMKRCLSFGMVMDDEPSPSHDFYLDSSDDDIPSVHDASEDKSSAENEEFFTAQNIFNNYEFFMAEMKTRMRNILETPTVESKQPFSLLLCQEMAAAYAKHEEEWPNCTKDKIVSDGIVNMKRLICDYHREYELATKLCMGIEAFRRLPFDQKQIVVKHFIVYFTELDRLYATTCLLGTDPTDVRLLCHSGVTVNYFKSDIDVTGVSDLDSAQLRSAFSKSNEMFYNICMKPFKKVNPDRFEFSYLCISVLWDLEGELGVSEETLKIAQKMRKRAGEELNFYYTVEQNLENYAARICKLQNLLSTMDRVNEIREENANLSRTFNLFKIDIYLHEITK